MKLTVVQPPYFAGEKPDEYVVDFLKKKMSRLQSGELMVLPEYSNAGGLSDPEKELAAAERAADVLAFAAKCAAKAGGYIAVNVLETRQGELKNSTYLFNTKGEVAFIYNKQHLPPSEIKMGVVAGEKNGRCSCVADVDGIRFAFMTCYDVYFNEQIEFIAAKKPDIIVVPGYQRAERTDIIKAQAKLTAFRCNAFLARSSFSMNSEEHGGNAMIVAPNGIILATLGAKVGEISYDIEPKQKYTRTAGFGGGVVRNDDFINNGLCPDAFK